MVYIYRFQITTKPQPSLLHTSPLRNSSNSTWPWSSGPGELGKLSSWMPAGDAWRCLEKCTLKQTWYCLILDMYKITYHKYIYIHIRNDSPTNGQLDCTNPPSFALKIIQHKIHPSPTYFTNPGFWDRFSKVRGENKKYLSCHHPDDLCRLCMLDDSTGTKGPCQNCQTVWHSNLHHPFPWSSFWDMLSSLTISMACLFCVCVCDAEMPESPLATWQYLFANSHNSQRNYDGNIMFGVERFVAIHSLCRGQNSLLHWIQGNMGIPVKYNITWMFRKSPL